MWRRRAQRDTGRFLNEAQALAAVKHPNIIAIYDIGVHDGSPFFTMELVEGRALAESLAQGRRFSYDEVQHVVEQLASAIDYLHLHGIVHRDIKDTNVMLADDGQVMLMDFGIALMGGARLTQTGYGMGTFYAAAPEQITGRDVGPPVDIYALGILTYQLLAGHPPFEGEPVHVLYAQAHDAPPPLRGVRPGLPRSAYAVVAQALAKSPAQRPASAKLFAEAFAGLLPTASHSQVSLPRLPRTARVGSLPIGPGQYAAQQGAGGVRGLVERLPPEIRASLPNPRLPRLTLSQAETPPPAGATIPPSAPARSNATGKLRGVVRAEPRNFVPSRRAIALFLVSLAFITGSYVFRSRPSPNTPLAAGFDQQFVGVTGDDPICCDVTLDQATVDKGGHVVLHLTFALHLGESWRGDSASESPPVASLDAGGRFAKLIAVEGDAAQPSDASMVTGWYTFASVGQGDTQAVLHYRNAVLTFALGRTGGR